MKELTNDKIIQLLSRFAKLKNISFQNSNHKVFGVDIEIYENCHNYFITSLEERIVNTKQIYKIHFQI